jgi:hypothetical protein
VAYVRLDLLTALRAAPGGAAAFVSRSAGSERSIPS